MGKLNLIQMGGPSFRKNTFWMNGLEIWLRTKTERVTLFYQKQKRYDRSKVREANNNENWIKQKVNLNEIVDQFIPENGDVVTQRTEGGVKYNFEGSRYIVRCDKVAGYLRIYDKKEKSYCLLDGTLSKNPEKTHFKIKRREEM